MQLRRGPRTPFLVAGAGLSWGLVPLPDSLLRDRRDAAETLLGCGPIGVDSTSEGALYTWAQEVLAFLAGDPAPKLRLAEALGLLSDTSWTAGVKTPLRGTTPRHRVLARFSRERRWAAIWSLNWDTHLENALERVGFQRGGSFRPGQPWQTQYQTIVTRDDFAFLGNVQYFCVLKPHGCVRALLEAKTRLDRGDAAGAKVLSDRLMIAAAELSNARDNPTDVQFFHELKAAIGRSPLMVLGWSISEPYLVGAINETMVPVLKLSTLEELTIIDPIFNTQGHTKAAAYYNLSRDQVFAELETNSGGIGADEFFLWLQARYALDCLAQHTDGSAAAAVTAFVRELDRPVASHYLSSWADDFLPAWTRLCWRGNLVHCAGYQAHELRLEERDFHVPWNLPPLVRPDMRAAATILSLIRSSGWDFFTFPGGAWDQAHGRLIIPMPAWGTLNDLAALKPLIEAMKGSMGFLQRVEILAVNDNPNVVISAAKIDELKQQLAVLMPVLRFANPDNIGTAVEIREV